MRGFIVICCLIAGCAVGAWYFADSFIGIGFVGLCVWLLVSLTSRAMALNGINPKIRTAGAGVKNAPPPEALVPADTESGAPLYPAPEPLPEERPWKVK